MFKSAKRILIIKLGSIGDVIHALPTISAIRGLYPTSEISLVIDEELSELVIDNPDLNEVIPFPRRRLKKDLSHLSIFKIIHSLRKIRKCLVKKQFDLSIDLQGMLISSLIVILSSAKHKIGNPEMRELSFLFSKRTGKYNSSQHAVDRYFTAAQYLGWKDTKKVFHLPIKIVNHSLPKTENLIGVGVGSRVRQKCWPIENYFELIRCIHEKFPTMNFVLLGKSKEDIGKLANLPNVINLINKTSLLELISIISKCRLFLGPDSGPLHISAAIGIPTIGLYGPTSPEITGPYGSSGIVITKRLRCSPCGRKPTCDNNICMKKISPWDVMKVISDILVQ